jgi:flagellar biosynthetic protein FlhB
MVEKPSAERTEQPTPRKISKAREKGQIAYSEEFVMAAVLFALVGLCALMGPYIVEWMAGQIKSSLTTRVDCFASSGAFMGFAWVKFYDFLIITAPFFLTIVGISVFASVVVSGWNFAPAALEPKFDNINPVAGFGKLFNVKSLVHLIISIAKLVFISVIVWVYVRGKLGDFAVLRWCETGDMLSQIGGLIFGLLVRVCVGLLVIGLADFAYQKWKYMDELKMTRQEVKEDHRETEGSPEIKSKIRQVQFQMSRKRMLQDVKKANVVIVNPTHIAIAIRYDSKTDASPLVVAKGAGEVAEKIMKIARAYGVPIVRRPELARTIFKTVELGKSIPEALYVAVAEVLAMIYRLKHRKG